MKKLTIIAAIAMVGCISAFTFTGCGASNAESTTSEASETSKVEENSKVDGKYVSIEACISDPEFKDAFQTADTDEYSVDIKAEGDSFVYEYTYKTAIEDVDAQKELLETASSTDSVKSVMVNVANTFKEFVDVENPSVVTRYFNSDGTLIYEAKYEADAE